VIRSQFEIVFAEVLIMPHSTIWTLPPAEEPPLPPHNSSTVKFHPAEVEYGVHDNELVLIKYVVSTVGETIANAEVPPQLSVRVPV
jgi:hypothetical protein